MPLAVSGPPALRAAARPLRAIVRLALGPEARICGDITVVLTRDRELRALNRRWRGIDRATDVLSFSYDGPGLPRRSRRVDGDLAISLDRVAAQARRFRVTRGEELARLVIHGALHLAGLDHQRQAERRHMRAREDAALRRSRTPARALDRLLAPPVDRGRGQRTRAAQRSSGLARRGRRVTRGARSG